MAQPARRRRGVTLIEAVLYISVALALIVGGLVFYRQASSASNINSLNRMLSAILVEARIISIESERSVGTAAVLWTPAQFESLLIAREGIPSAYLDMTRFPADRIRTPFGTPAIFFIGFNPSYIAVNLPNIPVAACTRLTTSSATGVTLFSTNLLNGNSGDNVSGGIQPVIRGQIISESGTKCKESDVNGRAIA